MINKKNRFKIELKFNQVIEGGIIMFILLYGEIAITSVII